MKKFSPHFLAAAAFILTSYSFYIWLRIQHSLRIHEPRMSFGDTQDYLNLALQPLFSVSFWIARRPPVPLLFFKLMDNDPERIVAAQLWISIIAWGVLALVVWAAARSFLFKAAGFGLILTFSLGQNIIMWDSLILSDSLAMSLLALFLAACIWLAVEWKLHRYVLLTAASLLLVFARDTYAYLLLMGGVALLCILPFAANRRRLFLVSGLFLVLFGISNAQAAAGYRWRDPFYNVLSMRVLPNPEYLAYFETRGMPVTDALMERGGMSGYADGFAFLSDPRLEELRSWVNEHARGEYVRFLWHFKADALQSPLDDMQLIFNPDMYYYTATGYRPIIKDARLDELIYPARFGVFAFLISTFFAAVLVFPAVRERQALWFMPMMLVFLAYPQAVLVWNADANDIARHSIYHNIEWRLGIWLLVLFVTDYMLMKFAPAISMVRQRGFCVD